MSGLFAFQSELGGYHVWYESLAERRNLLYLQWVERPRFISTQFVLLSWYFDGLRIEHIPDILIERTDGSHLVVDVHYKSRNGQEKPDFLLKARLTEALAAVLGWEYRVVGPIPKQRARNLEHISGYARTSANVRDMAERLLHEISWPRSIAGVIADARARSVAQGHALAALFHLVWQRRVWIDLTDPIRTHTQVRVRQLPEDAWTPVGRTLARS